MKCLRPLNSAARDMVIGAGTVLLALLVVASHPHRSLADDSWIPRTADQDTPTSMPRQPPREAGAPAQRGPYLRPMTGSSREVDPRRWSMQPNTPAGGYRAAVPSRPPAWGSAPHWRAPQKRVRGTGTNRPDAVEATDLAPLPAPGDGTGGTGGTGPSLVQAKATDPRVAGKDWADVTVPVRSATLTGLLRRLLVGRDSMLRGRTPQLIALRAELLYRAGLVGEAADQVPAAWTAASLAGERGQQRPAAVLLALAARVALAADQHERACRAARAAAQHRDRLGPAIRTTVLAIQGYCLAKDGNLAAAGLAATLAREEGSTATETLSILEAIALGETPKLERFALTHVLDWRLARLAQLGGRDLRVQTASPALLAVLARAPDIDARIGLEAAEAAARLQVIDAHGLAAAYRRRRFQPGQLERASSTQAAAFERRALLFSAASRERTPFKQVRLVRSLLDDARRADLYLPIARALAPVVADIRPVQEIGWFAETAVATLLTARRFEAARRWIRFNGQAVIGADGAGGDLDHWLVLIDVARGGPPADAEQHLAAVERQAMRGRFGPTALHRLVTVLDALDFQVPMRLWDLASRGPQPNTGHLPATGVLATLAAAAKAKDLARTIPLVLRALGPAGAQGAHLLALGDALRALRSAGLEDEARAVAFEALILLWPRTTNT